MKSNLIDLEVHIHVETSPHDPEAGALRVSLDGDDKNGVWLPKSQIEFERRGRTAGVVTGPEQLFFEKRLI